MSLTTLLFSFRGRATRTHYWLTLLASILVLGAATGIEVATETWGLSLVASLLILWPSLAVQAKRWHDRDKSAWWILIAVVPVIGPAWALIEAGFLAGTPTENRFGAPAA